MAEVCFRQNSVSKSLRKGFFPVQFTGDISSHSSLTWSLWWRSQKAFLCAPSSLDQILPRGQIWSKEMLNNYSCFCCNSRKPQGSPLTHTHVGRKKGPKFYFCFFPFPPSCSGYMWVGRLGGGRGRFTVKGNSQHQHRRARAVFSEGGRLFSFTLLQNDPAGSTLGREGRWGSSVQNSCWDISEYLLLEDFFFFFIQKEGAVGKGSGFICL